MSEWKKILAIQFVEWMHKHKYTKYWGSDEPNCNKWYIYGTMPDRNYYTLEELFNIFEREQDDYKKQSTCNLLQVGKCDGFERKDSVYESRCEIDRLGVWCDGCEDKYRCNLYKAN